MTGFTCKTRSGLRVAERAERAGGNSKRSLGFRTVLHRHVESEHKLVRLLRSAHGLSRVGVAQESQVGQNRIVHT